MHCVILLALHDEQEYEHPLQLPVEVNVNPFLHFLQVFVSLHLSQLLGHKSHVMPSKNSPDKHSVQLLGAPEHDKQLLSHLSHVEVEILRYAPVMQAVQIDVSSGL